MSLDLSVFCFLLLQFKKNWLQVFLLSFLGCFPSSQSLMCWLSQALACAISDGSPHISMLVLVLGTEHRTSHTLTLCTLTVLHIHGQDIFRWHSYCDIPKTHISMPSVSEASTKPTALQDCSFYLRQVLPSLSLLTWFMTLPYLEQSICCSCEFSARTWRRSFPRQGSYQPS